jgi:hypothetical protein
MSELTPLHKIPNKTSVGSGVVGIGLGTVAAAIAPRVAENASVIASIQILAPTMTIVGAWVTRFLIGQLRSYYMIWATQRIDRQISSYIKDENNTTEHIRNLQAKRERLQIRTIDLMEENLLSTDVIAGIVPNQALESTRSPHAALR